MPNTSKRTHNRWILLLFSMLLTISVAWVVFDRIFDPTHASKTVTVPDFSGMAIEEVQAEAWMELVTEYRYDETVEAGRVISQVPRGGSRRKLGRERPTCKIVLTVSLGEETVTLPDVVGMDVREAESMLRKLGFAVRTNVSTGAYPEGEVFEMSPRGESVLPKGATVTLSVSAGVPAVTVTVPDVRGLSRSEALMQLWLAQLSVLDVIEEDSVEEPGVVIRQNYLPGTVVMAGTKLTLYVSREQIE